MRSSHKGPFVDHHLTKKVDKHIKDGLMTPIKTWSRRSTILPKFVGLTFLVHNGRKFISTLVTENMVGHKLGEFSWTRLFKQHSGEKRRKAL